MAEVISDSAGGGNGCPEEANAVPPQLVAQLGNGIETLLDRNETDATQQGSLRKAGDALTGVGAACTVAAACSLLHGSGERSRRGVSVGWTPTLRAMCFKIWSQTSELKAWQYGGKQTRQTSSDCGRSLDAGSRVPYPPSCESFVGSDIYCQSQGKDEAACLFQRRAPTFFHGRDGSCNSDQLYFGMENCLGTEEWCNGWWISEKSNVTAKECLRRRASFNLDFNLPCVEIKNLRVDFSLRDGEKGARTGTVDNITLTMGRGNTLLAVAPPTGYSVSKSIDLEAAYGSKVVNLRQIDGAILIDQPNRNDLQPMWSFKGLTLTATCADSYDTVEIKKFRSVNRQIQHPGGSKALQVWSGRILPRDWRPMSTPEQPSTSGESTKSSTPRESARPSSQPIESAKLPTRIEDESRKPSPAAEATQRPPSNPPPRHDELKKFHNVDDPWHMMQGDNTGVTSSSSSSSSSSSPETENPHGNDRSRFPPDDEIETPAPIPSHRETIDCVEAGISWTNRDMNSRRVAEGFADCGRDDRPGESWRWWLGKYLIECKDGDDNCEVHQPDTMSDEAKGRAGQFGIPTQVPPTSEERDTVNPSTGRVTMDCVKAGVSWTIRNRHSRRVVNGIVDCGRADRPGESWRWWLGKYLVECKDHDKYCQVHQPDTMSDEAKRRANEFGIPTQLPPSEEEDLMLWHGLRRKRVGCQGMAWNDDDDERTRLVATGAAVCVRRDDPNMSWRWEDGKLVECRLKPINKVYHCRYHDPNNLPADVKARADSFFIPTTPPPTPPTMVMGA
ncbi:hypothetical protein XA68_15374 [Ophiocordyceps unilateralis]|uniref:Uncharacterized protein n=1 Tax=Ophiocordyceps unilateralis TaxID=268505 RepID=A0A2A9PLX5_OPHUN|nr:hypothetical protein XA68_15374 [Ophiocordyceps unilateralis]